MRHLIRPYLIILFFFLVCNPSYSTLSTGIEYKIPIDYSRLSLEELENRASMYYYLALKSSNGKVNDDITQALNLYRILSNKNPSEIIYAIRLGTLYDEIGKDRLAKHCFINAVELDNQSPENYYRIGNFYYKREYYRKALAMYKEAYKKGYATHYETLYQIGDIYEKFGDTEASIKYLNLAKEQSPNSKLDAKIQKMQNANVINKEYYSNTRIRVWDK